MLNPRNPTLSVGCFTLGFDLFLSPKGASL